MTFGANFNFGQFFGGTDCENIAASASDIGILKIFWMDVFFHDIYLIKLAAENQETLDFLAG